jgi:hypothetical protein
LFTQKPLFLYRNFDSQLKLSNMYNYEFTATGKVTLRHFDDIEQQRVMAVLNKVVAEYDGKRVDTPQLRCLKNDYYQFIVDYELRIMTKLKGRTFRVIDVFENSSLAELVTH